MHLLQGGQELANLPYCGICKQIAKENSHLCANRGCCIKCWRTNSAFAFRLPVNALDVPNFRISTQLRQLLNSIDMLIIDEVSMLTSYLLDAIDFRLRTARRKMEDAFGGVQVVCFGDVFQLPPVRPRGEAEAKWLADNYTSLWFFDARVWKETPLNIHTLKTVHRQNDDNFKGCCKRCAMPISLYRICRY